MSQAENERKMRQGSEAAMVEGVLAPYINEHISADIRRMVAATRGGQLEYEKLIVFAARITAMFDLLADLENVQRQGHVAAMKEMSSAEAQEQA